MQPMAHGPRAELALAQIGARIRRDLEPFQKLTKLTALIIPAPTAPGALPAAPPPPGGGGFHPLCARRVQRTRTAPCKGRWPLRLRSGHQAPEVTNPTCPIGLCCSWVAIQAGDRLMGMTILVADSRTTRQAFQAARDVLRLLIAGACRDSMVAALSEETENLKERVLGLERILAKGGPPAGGPGSLIGARGLDQARGGGCAIVGRAVAYLHKHYQEVHLSLPAVAQALGCHPRYLTTRFTQIVGERMRPYLLGLRVTDACRLLIGTGMPIKEISYAAGFSSPTWFSEVFRRRVGISPTEYRCIHASS